MADEGIMATTQQVLDKAGANVSSTSSAEAYTNRFVAQAEAVVNSLTRYNWNDDYAGLNVDVKGLLSDAVACYAAMMVIQYDMSGMSSREAETRLDFLRDAFERNIRALIDIKVRDFVKGE
jgi:hypothetical protein